MAVISAKRASLIAPIVPLMIYAVLKVKRCKPRQQKSQTVSSLAFMN